MASEADYIDAVLQEWAPTVVQALHEGIKQRGLLLTDDLYRSLRWEILKATSGMVATAKLSFRTHGRWRDMKTIRNGKQAPVDAIIEEFVRKVGVNNFKFVPGYTKGGAVPTDDIAIRRIAWGISKGMLKRNQTKARKWYSKNFYGAISVLIDKLMGSAQNKAAETITKGLE
jgi:hypothetical protein